MSDPTERHGGTDGGKLPKKLFSSPRQNWLSACRYLEESGEPYCIATIVAEAGSVPRARGSKMVISAHHQFDTLGGGNLEYQVIRKAREALKKSATDPVIERFSLAADLEQCCGGAVQVLLEFMQTIQPRVVVFGAGHVSRALTTILRDLPCHLTVVDNRPDWLEPLAASGITTHCSDNPADLVSELPSGAYLVVMTQDHKLDFEITRAALERNCFSFVGLIGSEAKKKRFSFRLEEQLSDPGLLASLTCPVGHPDIRGKLPMQVAVSVAAQLITLFEKAESGQTQEQNSKSWQDATSLRKALTKERK